MAGHAMLCKELLNVIRSDNLVADARRYLEGQPVADKNAGEEQSLSHWNVL